MLGGGNQTTGIWSLGRYANLPQNSIRSNPPVLPSWLIHYRRSNLSSDALAGVIVTVLVIPQSLAYAMLAGLPPQAGLYASIFPVVVYAWLGSSALQAVGPVATWVLAWTGPNMTWPPSLPR